MAANTISSAFQENIVLAGTEALSESMGLLGLVVKDAAPTPGNKGQSFAVTQYVDKEASAITAANYSPDADADTFGAKSIALDTHVGDRFKLTGTEFQGNNLDFTFLNQVKELVRSCVYKVNADLWALYKKVPYIAGNAARSIFNNGTVASSDPLADVGKVLNQNRVGMNRSLVVGPTEQANAQKVTELKQANAFGDRSVIADGIIGRAQGFDIVMDQQAPTHTTGTITTGLVVKAATTPAVGDTTLVCTTAASTGACALVEGDVVSIDGYTYALTADATQASAASDVTLSLDRGLVSAPSAGEAVTIATGHGSGVISLAGDMTGFGLVNRVEATSYYGGNTMGSHMVVTHPSGVSLSLGVYEQYHQQLFEASILYGVELVDSRKLCRALGE